MTNKKQNPPGLSYKDAGVDIDAGASLVERIKPMVKSTKRPEQITGLGGFASLTQIPSHYKNPVLVSGTDGVGTKLELALKYDRHEAIGQDLVAMCVNDVLVCGGEPLFFLDYLATGKLNVDLAERVIKGIAEGCKLAGCSLAGGETAEMPGFYHNDQYDLAGFCVGVAEKSRLIDGSNLKLGDKIIGLPSSGPHSNGFSLIRKVLTITDLNQDRLVNSMMNPTRIYVKSVLSLIKKIKVNAMVHITGGGFYENVRRVIQKEELSAKIEVSSWQRPEFFSWLKSEGNISEREMLTTFNCGIGFLVIVDQADAARTSKLLEQLGEAPVSIGEIVSKEEMIRDTEILI